MRIEIFICILVLFCPAGIVSAESSDALYKKGVSLARASNIIEAEKTFRRVIEISPWFCLGHYGLGRTLLMKKGNLDDAVKHLKRSVELDRSFAKGYFYLGLALFMNKKYIPAIHAFMDAYKNEPVMIEALYNTGAVYDVIGNPFKSKYYFSKYFLEKKRRDEGRIF